MNITDKAKVYSEGGVLETLRSVIEKAYADGYNDGYKAVISDYNRVMELKSKTDDYTLIDLDLPSGTLWSSTSLNNALTHSPFLYTYKEAIAFQIPTKVQFEELIRECEQIYSPKGVTFSRNGKMIFIPYACVKTESNILKHFYFWLKDDLHTGMAFCANSEKSGWIVINPNLEKLPVMVVG